MRKILFVIIIMITNIAFANVEIVADIHDVSGRVGDAIKIQSLHNIHIINTSGHREKYHFTFCLETDGKRACNYETFTVDNGKKETRYRTNTKYWIPAADAIGAHNIKSLTSVNGVMKEANATVKVTK